jgi:type II secretory pathway predicted ATPase ExeA
MYEAYYGFKMKPFSKTPDPRFLYMSKAHAEALARLQYGVEEKEFILLTGEIGSGKTTLSRALIDSLNSSHQIILIINPRLSPTNLLKTLAKGFSIDRLPRSRNDILEEIYNSLYNLYTEGRVPVIIIDEAQIIPGRETFEEIRLLTNFQLDDTNLFSLMLIGQPDLRKRLEGKAYQSLRQRIGLLYHLGGLSEEEVSAYISHRMAVAGREEKTFSDGAIRSIHRYSGGIPRKINSLCTYALLEGFGKGISLIDEEIIEDVAGELGFTLKA